MRILFIGNSHTYRNGLPYILREMIVSREPASNCETWMVAPSGRSLGEHVNDPVLHFALACNSWDFVVLQQRSHPFDGYEKLLSDYDKLKPSLQISAARVLLFMTWKKKHAPDSAQAELDAAFERLRRERDVSAVPVGPAWQHARQAYPDVDLYERDAAHASVNGTYLAACVFYEFLMKQSSAGLPGKITAMNTPLTNLTGRLPAANSVGSPRKQGPRRRSLFFKTTRVLNKWPKVAERDNSGAERRRMVAERDNLSATA